MKDLFLLFFGPEITFPSPGGSAISPQLPICLFIGIHSENAFLSAAIVASLYAIGLWDEAFVWRKQHARHEVTGLYPA
ncbi:hypothetical protein AB28_1978 [Raoultella ornithinolytica 2-156-04_S1_C2]|nr:hypothetical protein AB00_1788 [Raoultella ornithinolytica 2-156-04_S1_C1]KDX13875.1 hypothetical protein AB28_1978 [Raoultella ornithinolytica 2-156-04_S1_C2]